MDPGREVRGPGPPFELSNRLVITCFKRIFPISSLSFFFLPCFEFYFFKRVPPPLLWKCLAPPLVVKGGTGTNV